MSSKILTSLKMKVAEIALSLYDAKKLNKSSYMSIIKYTQKLKARKNKLEEMKDQLTEAKDTESKKRYNKKSLKGLITRRGELDSIISDDVVNEAVKNANNKLTKEMRHAKFENALE